MNIYICARVAHDARQLNSEVGAALRDAGHAVYLPQEQAPNNLTPDDIAEGRYDVRTIFLLDYGALQKSHVVVAVGRMGADCAWELGYAWAKGIPVVHVPGTDMQWTKSPMLIPTLCERKEATVYTVVDRVEVAIEEEYP